MRSTGSSHGRSGCSWRFDSGRKSKNSRVASSASMSFSNATSATPDLVVCVIAPPKLVLGHDLVGHGLHHLGAGDEHVGAVLHHEDEVGHRRRIDRAARARAHDQADLRDDTAGEHVALEHFGIAGEAGDAFLDARAAAESLRPMTGAPTFIAMSMTLQIFCAWRSLKRAAEHGEVLREDIDQAAVDRARSGDHAVARDLLLGHPEVGRIMLDEHVIFFEAAGIEQDATGARARSAGPWHAAPRCASRRRPAGPPRAVFQALRWWLPTAGSPI